MPAPAVRVAAVQTSPVFLDRDATVEKVADLTAKAAADGAALVVFPETFLPGYPDWVWRSPAWRDGAWYDRLMEQAVSVPGPTTARLGEIAAASGVYLVVGVSERSANAGTLYNSLLYFAPDGALLANHRKLVPTGGERTIWGMGDGSTLSVIETPFGRVGGLICWENYMPLARAAMYAQSVDIWLAPTWDNSDMWVPTLRHIAKEGGVFVVGSTACLHGSQVTVDLPNREDWYSGEDDDWMSRGNTTIVGPDGDILAGPLVGEDGIVAADLDLARVRTARRFFDPVGHYARPDVFELRVDTRPKPGVSFDPGR